MATNPYFRSSYFAKDADQKLVQQLTTEAIQTHGIDVKYLPRNLVNFDDLFGEDQSSNFDRAYTIEVYLKSFDGFGGDGKFLSKFGIEIRDEMTFSVSRPRFKAEVAVNEADIHKPREGDLIVVQDAIDQRERILEITYVDSEEVFYQLGSLYTWEIRTKVFELGGETFETGIEGIDDIVDFAINTELTVSNVTGTFSPNENITSSTGSANVISFSGDKLVVSNIIGTLSGTVTGQTSGATATVVTVSDPIENDRGSDNNYIDDAVTDFVDFTETNPFSE